jgi:hypothetical protein
MTDEETIPNLLRQVPALGDPAMENADLMAIGYIFIAIAQAHEVSLAELINVASRALTQKAHGTAGSYETGAQA